MLISVFLCHPALVAGGSGREEHDEYLDTAEGLPPDKCHSEGPQGACEAGALHEGPGGHGENWVRLKGNCLILLRRKVPSHEKV